MAVIGPGSSGRKLVARDAKEIGVPAAWLDHVRTGETVHSKSEFVRIVGSRCR
jgi:hypothetical protein